MNKKFLSAILFGALMATSAGTFVSCKDYDDDINNLQEQIDKNSSAIAELQKLVGSGKWVSSISSIENGFTVVMSDGSSHQIKGINGKDGANGQDGKNGAEWTIGTDGFWYVDGEKTENVAVAKDGENGKDGVSAPAPYIGTDGNWVVYSWDAEKGEFVAEETEISAQGTNAYAVKANGVYTLYIADENGEMQEIALPATCDAIVVEAPYSSVVVSFETATWTEWAEDKKSEAGKALLAKYPELAEIEKNAPMKQGGKLPLIVTPAAVELTDEYTFSLQNADGTIADIALSTPVKGADMDWNRAGTALVSRSAKDACIWSLNVEPAYDKKKYPEAPHYAAVGNRASLVVKNEKGTVVRTAFAYTVTPASIERDVIIKSSADLIPFAESIDLFAGYYKNGALMDAPIEFVNDYKNHYIVAVANALEAEKYGLSIAEDGHTLNITKMPASELKIDVHLTVVALGLNGSVKSSTVTLSIGQEIAASEGLTPGEVTLNKKEQLVTWKYAELGLSAVAFENFYNGNVITITATREADKNEDGETEKYIAFDGKVDAAAGVAEKVMFFNAKGQETKYTTGTGAWSNGAPETFGFYVDADTKTASTTADYNKEYWTAGVYTVTLTSKKGNNTVVYAVQTELTVKNPELTADYVKVVSAFLEDGIAQITGAPTGNVVEFDLENVLATANGATVDHFIDYDNKLYDDENVEDYAYYKWVNPNNVAAKKHYLIVNKWSYEPETFNPANPWYSAHSQQLYQVRNIRAMIKLFNEGNLVPFDFQVIVKSEIYSEDGSSITFDAAKLKGKFTAGTTKANEINVTKAITAKAVAGEGKGKTYNLFATKDSYGNTTTVNYAKPKEAGGYILATGGTSVYALSGLNYLNFCTITGETVNQEIAAGTKTRPLSKTEFDYLWAIVGLYKNNDLTDKYYKVNGELYYVQWNNFKKNDDGDYEFTTGLSDKTPAYEHLYNNKGDMPSDALEIAKWTQALTVIPENVGGANHKFIVKFFNDIKSGIEFESKTTTGTGSKVDGTPRDPRVESVKIVFTEPEEAKKFFTNSIAADGKVFEDLVGTTGIIATATDYNAAAGDFILTAKDVADVTVTSGKVVVGLKLIIKDKWGMIMEVPFNVEVSVN